MGSKAFTSARRMIAVVAVTASVACTPIIRNHGYTPTAEDLDMILLGQDTRESVVAVAGPPTSKGVVGDSAFYYVSSKFRHFGAFAPEEIDRQVLKISFDEAGFVSNIEGFGLQEGNVVVLSRRVTDSGVRDSTFVRQLLGSIGQINAGDFLGEG